VRIREVASTGAYRRNHKRVIREALMTSVFEDLDLETRVAYEPCAGFHADDDPARCAGCGWSEEDHATVLRRAS
jgi:hypothetical protein